MAVTGATATNGRLGAVAGAGASAGVGFTVSLLVATLAFNGAQLEEAKAGILAAPLARAVHAAGARAKLAAS